jgi:hypothetical protein
LFHYLTGRGRESILIAGNIQLSGVQPAAEKRGCESILIAGDMQLSGVQPAAEKDGLRATLAALLTCSKRFGTGRKIDFIIISGLLSCKSRNIRRSFFRFYRKVCQ